MASAAVSWHHQHKHAAGCALPQNLNAEGQAPGLGKAHTEGLQWKPMQNAEVQSLTYSVSAVHMVSLHSCATLSHSGSMVTR